MTSGPSTNQIDQVLAAIDTRSDEIVRFASEFLQHPSVNPDLEPNDAAERPAQDWLKEQFNAAG
jgi:acetylornithine deacetylase/succinyl-diaminopimelate desuccinylase-like protein